MNQFFLLFRQWLKTFGLSFIASLLIDSLLKPDFTSAFIRNLPYFFVLTAILSLCSVSLFLNLIESIKENILLSFICYFFIPMLAAFYWLKELRENWPQHQEDFKMYLIISICYLLIQGYYFSRFRKTRAELL